MIVAGCYVLHVRCDNDTGHTYRNVEKEFTGATKTIAINNARKAGWKINVTDLCPRCANTLRLTQEVKR